MNVSRTKFDALHFPNASNSHLLAAISHARAARETTLTTLLIYTCYEQQVVTFAYASSWLGRTLLTGNRSSRKLF